MRKSVLLVTLVLMTTIWGTILIADDEMIVPMGDITIEPINDEPKRSEVVFPHAVHFGFACQQCHHTWENKEPIQGCSAAGCHDISSAPKTEDGKPVKDPVLRARYFKAAYHNMCIGCHKEIKKTNLAMEASKLSLGEKLLPTGPTGCKQCHPEE
jgi:hypothetical protein